MPFQPIDFSKIEPQGNPFFRDFATNLSEGYKIGQLPAQLARQKQKEELENAMQKLKVQNEPERAKAELTGQQLLNALNKYKVEEQPSLFNSEQASRAVLRAFNQAQANKLNTMTPLEAAKMSLENEWYPKAEQAKINEQNALADYRRAGGGGSGSNATAKAQRAFENSVARDNPHLSPDDLFEASNVYREGGDTLSDGTKLNPLSDASQSALDSVIKSSTTPTATASKKSMLAIEGAIPLIDELLAMDEPNQAIGTITSPNAQARYMDTVTTLKERLIGSLNFPKTNQGAKELSYTTSRQPFEGHENYHTRLQNLKTKLMGQYGIAKKYAGATSPANKNKEPTVEEEGTYKGKPVVKVNGEWHYK